MKYEMPLRSSITMTDSSHMKWLKYYLGWRCATPSQQELLHFELESAI